MKSFDSFVQGLITFAIMGVGVLIGLAMAVVVNGLDIGGVAPLFANAIGAAIGAAITLWTIEKRNQKASIETAKKNLTIAVADLSIIIVHARAIQTGLATGDIDNLVTNAVRVLNDALSHPRQILDVLLEAQFSEDYGAL